jgi:hypothetical protein
VVASKVRTDTCMPHALGPAPLRRCEKIGSGQNMSHKIVAILRKTGGSFKSFFVSWHFFLPSEAERWTYRAL